MNEQQLLPVIKACSKSRRLTVATPAPRAGVGVPCLRLRRRWLQDAGSAIGRHVKIEVSEGRTTIEACAAQAIEVLPAFSAGCMPIRAEAFAAQSVLSHSLRAHLIV